VLSLELTHNYGLLLPVLMSAVTAHAVTVLFQKRSILTERISRRGHHLSREYGVDPLEVILVSEVMQPRVVVLPAEMTPANAGQLLDNGRGNTERRGQHLYPLVDDQSRLTSVMTRRDLAEFAAGVSRSAPSAKAPIVAYPDETLRAVAERMATGGVFVLPVVEPGTEKLLGLVAAEDLLLGRERAYHRETKLERPRMPFGARRETNGEAVRESV
jgi:chloride channel protein, CIC family